MSENLRLFIASPVGDPAKTELLSRCTQREEIAAHIPGRIKWVTPENRHLTWLFLGKVDAERLPDIQAAMAEGLTGFSSVVAELEEIVFWPTPARATAIACKVRKTPELLRISDAVRQALPGFKADKPFSPHITLARLKDLESTRLPGWKDLRLPSPTLSGWTIGGVTLYQSTLTAQGPIYKALFTVPLAGDKRYG